jgi:hypothetical protein
MSLLSRWRALRARPVPVIDPPGYRSSMPPAPPPPRPEPAPLVRAAASRPKAKASMHLMLQDGTVEELPDPEMKARAEYLIQSMLPPAPPPPPVSS